MRGRLNTSPLPASAKNKQTEKNWVEGDKNDLCQPKKIITLPLFPCFRECCRFFGDNGLTLKVFFTKAAPFGVLWTLTNYLYLHAIKKINTTDVSVLFCCNKAFVFLLSWIVLRDRFMGVRVSSLFSVFLPHSVMPAKTCPSACLTPCAGPFSLSC